MIVQAFSSNSIKQDKKKLIDTDFRLIFTIYNKQDNTNEYEKSICQFLKKIENVHKIYVIDDGIKNKT